MSEDLLLARLARRPGLVDSPLGAIAAPYVSALRAARYSSHTIRSYLSHRPLRVLDQYSRTRPE